MKLNIYTHNHYNIPTNHNVHINHIHIIHENIKMLALGTEAQENMSRFQ
jgi:hypothetical protein